MIMGKNDQILKELRKEYFDFMGIYGVMTLTEVIMDSKRYQKSRIPALKMRSYFTRVTYEDGIRHYHYTVPVIRNGVKEMTDCEVQFTSEENDDPYQVYLCRHNFNSDKGYEKYLKNLMKLVNKYSDKKINSINELRMEGKR